MNIILKPSDKKDKRFKVIVDNKTIHFGLKNPKKGTFIDHQDKKLKDAYIKRHSALNEDWTKAGLKSGGFWSRYLLWNKPSLRDSIKNIENKYNLKIKYDS